MSNNKNIYNDCCSECRQCTYEIVVTGRFNGEKIKRPSSFYAALKGGSNENYYFYLCKNCLKKLIKKKYDVGYLRFGEV